MIRSYAAQIAMRNLFDEVGVGFHHGSPRFSECIDQLTGDRVVVVPVMTSTGYYSEVVLPRELARNGRFPQMQATITEPVGTHPAMVELVDARVRRNLGEFGFLPAEASLAIVGHGTRRYPGSRNATEALTCALRSRGGYFDVLCAFLDDDPPVATIPNRTANRELIVVPFLVADGPHAAQGIPAALGLPLECGTTLPASGQINGRRVLVVSAVGADPRLIDIIIARALESLASAAARELQEPCNVGCAAIPGPARDVVNEPVSDVASSSGTTTKFVDRESTIGACRSPSP
jgi:sirohydrochlorin cobaltochelatase